MAKNSFVARVNFTDPYLTTNTLLIHLIWNTSMFLAIFMTLVAYDDRSGRPRSNAETTIFTMTTEEKFLFIVGLRIKRYEYI